MNCNETAKKAVSGHLTPYTAWKKTSEGSAFAQLAKTSTAAMEAKYSVVCHSGLFTSGSGNSACAAALAASSCLYIKCMARPMTTLNTTAPMARAAPSSKPSMRAVSTMASTLMAGPE